MGWWSSQNWSGCSKDKVNVKGKVFLSGDLKQREISKVLIKKKWLVSSRCRSHVSASSNRAYWSSFHFWHRLHSTDGTRWTAAGLPMSPKCSHGYLLHGNNHSIVIPTHGAPLATSRQKICISAFLTAILRVYYSVFMCHVDDIEKEKLLLLWPLWL